MSSSPDPQPFDDEDEISLLEIATTIGEEKKTIAAITFGFAVIAAVVSLLMTPIYTARTTFLVPNPSGGSGLASALGGLGALAGGGVGSLLGGKSQDEMFVELLKTDTIANALIAQFKLQERYETENLDDTQRALANNTKITPIKKAGMISVEVDDKDPEFAAQLANAYITQLKKLMEAFAVTESQQRKEYYENELIRAKQELKGTSDYRDMKVRESVLAVLLSQYEVAVLDSAKETIIQVADKAVAPEIRSKPKRTLMVVIAALAGGFLSVLFVLVRRAYRNAQANPEDATQWQKLKRAWRLRS
jgi:tyrosine-protein kinase Etk/Wzc